MLGLVRFISSKNSNTVKYYYIFTAITSVFKEPLRAVQRVSSYKPIGLDLH